MAGWLKRFFGGARRPERRNTAPLPSPGLAAQQTPSGPFRLDEIREWDEARREPVDPGGEPGLCSAVLEHFSQVSKAVPPFPAIATKVHQAVNQPDVDLNELVRLMNSDPAIAGEVLRLANSPVYRGSIELESTRDAVLRLGLREVSKLASAASMLSLFDTDARATRARFGDAWRDVHHHLVTTAYGAGWLAMERNPGLYDRAFLGALLHDVGKVVVLRGLAGLPEPLASASPAAVDCVLEGLHTDIGAEVVRAWELPEGVVTICAAHHYVNIPAGPEHEAMHIVRVVSGLNETRRNPRYRDGLEAEIEGSVAALGIRNRRLRVLARQVEHFAEQTESLFTR